MIYDIEFIPQALSDDYAQEAVILAHGCFDILHPGHIAHLKAARDLGTALFVGITSDKYVKEAKGSSRPIMTANARAEIIDSLGFVNGVIIVDDPTAVPLIHAMKPRFFVRGDDHREDNSKGSEAEIEACNQVGTRLKYTAHRLGSSSEYIERIRRPSPKVTLPDRWTGEMIINWIDVASLVTVTGVGESIQDKYTYVEPAGKSPKENTISYICRGEDVWMGGIMAVMNHLRESCTVNLNEEVITSSPVNKSRYLDIPFGTKLFSISDHITVPPLSQESMNRILNCGSEMICIADFGHGLISNEMAIRISGRHEGFLALTVQANSLNYGFNTLRKWPSADYVVVDEGEMRLAGEDQYGDLVDMIREWYRDMKCRYLAVTRGHRGCIIFDGWDMKEYTPSPSIATDRMGAGDAFLGWTAGLASISAPIDVIGFIGNLAGSIQVGIPGNSRAVTRREIIDIIEEAECQTD